MIKKFISGRIFRVVSTYRTINTVTLAEEHGVLMSPRKLMPNNTVVVLLEHKVTTVNKILYDQCLVLTPLGTGWIPS